MLNVVVEPFISHLGGSFKVKDKDLLKVGFHNTVIRIPMPLLSPALA